MASTVVPSAPWPHVAGWHEIPRRLIQRRHRPPQAVGEDAPGCLPPRHPQQGSGCCWHAGSAAAAKSLLEDADPFGAAARWLLPAVAAPETAESAERVASAHRPLEAVHALRLEGDEGHGRGR